MKKPKSSMVYLLISMISFMTLASNYYVAPGGNNSDPGNLTKPWLTLRKAVQTARAGDTVFIRAGTYMENNLMNVNEGNSGKTGSPIVYKNYPAETPVIDGGFGAQTAAPGGDDLPIFNIQGKHYIVIDGLTIQHGWRANVAFSDDVQTTHITVRNCELRDFVANSNSGQFYFDNGDDWVGGADSILIENNRLHGMLASNDRASGIYMDFACRFIIRNNEIYGTPKGIYFKHSYPTGDSGLIENNYIHDVLEGIRLNSSNVTMQHNLFTSILNTYDAPGTAILLCGGDGPAEYQVTLNNRILHNTIVNCDAGIYLRRPSDTDGARNTIIRNNLISNFSQSQVRGISIWEYVAVDESKTTVEFNLINPASFAQPVRVLDKYYSTTILPVNLSPTKNIQEAPVFTGGKAPDTIADFALAANSPGKNSASDGTDMGANTSLVGLTKDIGGKVSAAERSFKTDFMNVENYRVSLYTIAGRKISEKNFTGQLRNQKSSLNDGRIGNQTYIVTLNRNNRSIAKSFVAVR